MTAWNDTYNQATRVHEHAECLSNILKSIQDKLWDTGTMSKEILSSCIDAEAEVVLIQKQMEVLAMVATSMNELAIKENDNAE